MRTLIYIASVLSFVLIACENNGVSQTEQGLERSLDSLMVMASDADSAHLEYILATIDSMLVDAENKEDSLKILEHKAGILWIEGDHDASLALSLELSKGSEINFLKTKSFICWVKEQHDSLQYYSCSALNYINSRLDTAFNEEKTRLLHAKFELLMMLNRKEDVRQLIDTLVAIDPDSYSSWQIRSFEHNYNVYQNNLDQFKQEYYTKK